jgi:hypothetical protein
MKKLCIVTLMMAALTSSVRAQDPDAGETATREAAPAPAEVNAPSDAAPVLATSESTEPADEANQGDAYDTRYPNKKYIDAVLERSSHRSLGYGLGRQGDGFVFGPRFDQPITKKNWLYMQLFQYTNFGPFRGDFDPVLMFGVNFISRTKLIMGIFRLYGGGGFHVGFRPSPACKNPLDQTDIARAYVYEGQPVSLAEPANPATPALLAVSERINDIRERCEKQKDAFGISGGGTGGIEFFSSPMRAYFIEISGGGGTQKNNIWSDSGLILRAGNQFYF